MDLWLLPPPPPKGLLGPARQPACMRQLGQRPQRQLPATRPCSQIVLRRVWPPTPPGSAPPAQVQPPCPARPAHHSSNPSPRAPRPVPLRRPAARRQRGRIPLQGHKDSLPVDLAYFRPS